MTSVESYTTHAGNPKSYALSISILEEAKQSLSNLPLLPLLPCRNQDVDCTLRTRASCQSLRAAGPAHFTHIRRRSERRTLLRAQLPRPRVLLRQPRIRAHRLFPLFDQLPFLAFAPGDVPRWSRARHSLLVPLKSSGHNPGGACDRVVLPVTFCTRVACT